MKMHNIQIINTWHISELLTKIPLVLLLPAWQGVELWCSHCLSALTISWSSSISLSDWFFDIPPSSSHPEKGFTIGGGMDRWWYVLLSLLRVLVWLSSNVVFLSNSGLLTSSSSSELGLFSNWRAERRFLRGTLPVGPTLCDPRWGESWVELSGPTFLPIGNAGAERKRHDLVDTANPCNFWLALIGFVVVGGEVGVGAVERFPEENGEGICEEEDPEGETLWASFLYI